jgi:hypothetical protein
MVEKNIMCEAAHHVVGPAACRKGAVFTKGWLGVQSPRKERLLPNPKQKPKATPSLDTGIADFAEPRQTDFTRQPKPKHPTKRPAST